MALRKIGNRYFVYYNDVDGHRRTRALKTGDKEEAIRSHAEYMKHVRTKKSRYKILQDFPDLKSEQLPEVKEIPLQHRRGSIRLEDMFEAASRYRELSDLHKSALTRLIKAVNVRYADQVTPRLALNYLNAEFGKGNGKTFNNHKTYLNTIFKLCTVETGIPSPFDQVMNMRVRDVQGHRRITEEEFKRLYSAAQEPWKTALLMSWHTGLRVSDCFTLKWSEIRNDWIAKIPKKTSRFNRAVMIPIHPELKTHLDSLPKPKDKEKAILAPYVTERFKRVSGARMRCIQNLFQTCGILDNQDGKASFHSLRVSFVTRCEEAGIPRAAIRGMVGHVSDNTTDIYSQDQETPKQILSLPGVLG